MLCLECSQGPAREVEHSHQSAETHRVSPHHHEALNSHPPRVISPQPLFLEQLPVLGGFFVPLFLCLLLSATHC